MKGNEDARNIRSRTTCENTDEPLESALEEFQKIWISSEKLDPEAFCQKHGECGPELRRMIDDFVFIAESLPENINEGDNNFVKNLRNGELGTGNILGDFRIIRELGRGGSGVVYMAEQISLNRNVALKVLSHHLRLSVEAVIKFGREAEALGRQSHSGIVSIYGVGECKGTHYFAQELVENGSTLYDKLYVLSEKESLPKGYFRDVAELISAVADALQHAHDTGVIHRDVKPSNILLTKEGQPKITDFGLAKIDDALTLSRTGDFAGTPYYMSPEQAMSRRIEIDKRTDVYSLGVTLYELMTLKRPFDGDTSHEILKKIIFADPIEPHIVNPHAPRDLSLICLKAMEKNPKHRYQSMMEFYEDLQRYLYGEVILAKPTGLKTRIWKKLKRYPVLSATTTVTFIALLGILGFVLLWSVPRIKEEKNRAQKAVQECEERNKELVEITDIFKLNYLISYAEEIWPAYPENIPRLQWWIGQASELLNRLDIHRNTKKALIGEVSIHEKDLLEYIEKNRIENIFWDSNEEKSIWRLKGVVGLISDLENMLDENTGILKDVTDRLKFAQNIKKASIDDYEEEWSQAIKSISDPFQCPLYNGLTIKPQIGFVPVGRDVRTGLWEFVNLQTGEIPERKPDGYLDIKETTGLVFVLIPGGHFNMGAENQSENNFESKSNIDPWAKNYEGPIHSVFIKSFLLSKYEMTQGQWLSFSGENPSIYKPDNNYDSNKEKGLLHPVENISWKQSYQVLSRLKLRLPSESEWEYAARATTETVWHTGDNEKTLIGYANLYDSYYMNSSGPEREGCEDWLNDNYIVHAPVGSYKANHFGLHDVVGNVYEWCYDTFLESYEKAPVDGSALIDENECTCRIIRGGSWRDAAEESRSATRFYLNWDKIESIVGIRPAFDLME